MTCISRVSSPFKCEFIEIQDGDGPFLDESSFGLNPNMLSLSWWSSVFGNVKSWFGWKSDNLAYSEDIDRISETGSECFSNSKLLLTVLL